MISTDKMLHFLAGMSIVGVSSTCMPGIANWAFVAAIIAGVAKEIYDEVSYGGFDLIDLLSTTVGGATMQVLVWTF